MDNMTTPKRLTPRAAPAYDPRGAHQRHQPRARCYGCGAGSHETRLLHLDSRGLDWHADCYVTILQTAPPRDWRLGRRVLPFTR
jgi:hypothetical protein